MVLSTSSTALGKDYIPGLSSATFGRDPYAKAPPFSAVGGALPVLDSI